MREPRKRKQSLWPKWPKKKVDLPLKQKKRKLTLRILRAETRFMKCLKRG
jgi:hypothetical protein